MTKKLSVFAFGLAAYLLFFITVLYGIGFVGNIVVPKGIDDGAATSVAMAMFIDLALIALFGLQHSVMARPAFKRQWTRFIAEPVERSVYVLCASLLLALLYWQW